MSVELAAMDPLAPPACLLCGERFEPEGYSERFAPELLPGATSLRAEGFAPAKVVVEDRFAGFVCPGCFGDGREDLLARAMKRGAQRLRGLARELEGGA